MIRPLNKVVLVFPKCSNYLRVAAVITTLWITLLKRNNLLFPKYLRVITISIL